MKKTLRLGSRGSPLALLQAEEVRKKIFAVAEGIASTTDIEIVPIRTTGDWRPGNRETSFRDNGGNKELFTKEIEDALLQGHIDMAVHSMKDVASVLPPKLEIAAMLERLDPREAFIGRRARALNELPEGATVGTSSVRRQAQILARRPDLRVVPLRGNVETRIKKLENGHADATVLALAGLMRLGLQGRASSIMETDVMLPSVAQGVIGVQIRRDDDDVRHVLAPINAPATFVCVTAERAFLRELDGSCATPIAGLAVLRDEKIVLDGMVAKPDGTSTVRMQTSGPATAAEKIGTDLGKRMKSSLPANFHAA